MWLSERVRVGVGGFINHGTEMPHTILRSINMGVLKSRGYAAAQFLMNREDRIIKAIDKKGFKAVPSKRDIRAAAIGKDTQKRLHTMCANL